MAKFIIVLAAAVGLIAAAFASAATVSVNGGTLQVGSDANLQCTNELDVTAWGVDDSAHQGATPNGTVTYMKVNVPQGCEKNKIFGRVEDATGVIAYTGQGTGTDCSAATHAGFIPGTAGEVVLCLVPQSGTVLTDSTYHHGYDAGQITKVTLWTEGSGGNVN